MRVVGRIRSLVGEALSVVAERRARRAVSALIDARAPLAHGHYRVMVYFADQPVNLYQIRQWYAPLAELSRIAPVVVVTRDAKTTLTLLDECPVDVEWASRIGEIEVLVDNQDIAICFYVNQNTLNFRNMRFARMFHVFVNHGESDKAYMASNQIKAYDYSFAAGEAALDRLRGRLLDYDVDRRSLLVGRPQIDVTGAVPDLPATDRRTVLYAPTWEGDRPSMTYGSVSTHGAALIRSFVASGSYRVIYRPHPRTGKSDRSNRADDKVIRDLIADANRRDPRAGHMVDQSSQFSWQLQVADACVCDISAVALDWLATRKPLLVTLPSSETAAIDRTGFLSAVEMLAEADVPDAVARLDRMASDPDWLAKTKPWVDYYFGDTTPGASIRRYLETCQRLIAHRDEVVQALDTSVAVSSGRRPRLDS